ncbi:ABC transporter permease, partial [Enterococcus faecalis]|nr:ABC transporter permease [Enterococcus faecalis]
MSLYKAVLKILKANKTNLLIAVIVPVIITFFYAQNTAAPDAKLDRGTMTIVTEDNSALSKALIDYLKEEQTVVE